MDEGTIDTGGLRDVTQVPHIVPAISVLGLNLHKPFSLGLNRDSAKRSSRGKV